MALFAVFPLTINYPSILAGTAGNLPAGGLVTLPKTIVLSICWVAGLLLALALAPEAGFGSLPRWLRRAHPIAWALIGLTLWIVIAAFFANTHLRSPWFGSNVRDDGVVFEVLWFSLLAVAWGVARGSRAVGRAAVVAPLLVAASLAAVWTSLESYGFEPMSLLSASISPRTQGFTAAASLGNQALASIFVAVAALTLSAWFALRGVRARGPLGLRSVLGGLLICVLWFGAFASGGRSGSYAAAGVWVVFVLAASLLRPTSSRFSRRRAIAVTGAILVVAVVVGLTNGNARAKADATVQGGQSFAHRLITWRVGLRTVAARPLVGYGPDAFATELWRFARPAEARELMTSVVPRQDLATAKRKDNAVVYLTPDHQVHMVILNYDKAHNYLIDLAVASGVPAVVFFLALVLLVALVLIRSPDPAGYVAFLGLLAFLVAQQAWFYTVSIDPILWAWMGVSLAWAGSAAGRARAS